MITRSPASRARSIVSSSDQSSRHVWEMLDGGLVSVKKQSGRHERSRGRWRRVPQCKLKSQDARSMDRSFPSLATNHRESCLTCLPMDLLRPDYSLARYGSMGSTRWAHASSSSTSSGTVTTTSRSPLQFPSIPRRSPRSSSAVMLGRPRD